MGMLHATSRLIARALDDLMPDAPARHWARARQAGWSPDSAQDYCGRCGYSLGPGAAREPTCGFCRQMRPAWGHIVRLGSYRGPIHGWVTQIKFEQAWGWGEILGRELAPQARAASAAADPAEHARVVVCPVPMHLFRRLRRGYNQSELMAKALAAANGWVFAPALRRTRYSPPQTTATLSRRRENVRDTFAPTGFDLSEREVWLVDDVKTTGATLSACCQLLREAGAERINVAVAVVADPPELRAQSESTPEDGAI